MRPKFPFNYAEVIDELGDVQAKLAKYSDLRKREEVLRERIVNWLEPVSATAACTLIGLRYEMCASPRRLERRILSMRAVFKALGEKLFLARCSVALKVLEEELSLTKRVGLTAEARTGARTITTVPKTEQAKRKKAA
jgi:hypothetical protein